VRRALIHLVALSLVCASALALGAAFPARVRIPARDPAAPRSMPAAWFSHRAHQSFGCYACHPSTFAQAPIGFTHEEMRQRRFCGQCHDGATGFAIEGAPCKRCHVR